MYLRSDCRGRRLRYSPSVAQGQGEQQGDLIADRNAALADDAYRCISPLRIKDDLYASLCSAFTQVSERHMVIRGSCRSKSA